MEIKLTEKLLESRRREMMYGVAEFSAWLGFRSKSKTKTRSLIAQYRQFCAAISGVKGYSAGPKTRRMVAKKLGLIEMEK